MTLSGTPAGTSRRTTLRWVAAVVLWICVIWGHSLVQGPESSAESGFVVSLVRPLFEAAGVLDADLMSLVVRKCAHFSEYAVLGVLVRGLLAARRRDFGRPALPVGLLVCLVPVADECIQLGVPGRVSSPVDVAIDLCGVTAGVLASLAVARAARRNCFRRV